MRETPVFGNSTCLQIAQLANNLDFISHPSVQDLIVKIWYNKIPHEVGKLKVLNHE